MIDQKQLEADIATYTPEILRAIHNERLERILAAARAYAETLPEPQQWRVRLCRDPHEDVMFTFETSLAALAKASWACANGYDRIEIEAP